MQSHWGAMFLCAMCLGTLFFGVMSLGAMTLGLLSLWCNVLGLQCLWDAMCLVCNVLGMQCAWDAMCFGFNVLELHRWALSLKSAMTDIGLSLYQTDRLKICRIFRYRTKVFSDIWYPTSKFLKSWCTRSLKGTFSRKRFLDYLFKC
jgi:hypothetical protein